MTSPPKEASKLGQFSWALFDWANQPFFTIITTFIFAPYFARSSRSRKNRMPPLPTSVSCWPRRNSIGVECLIGFRSMSRDQSPAWAGKTLSTAFGTGTSCRGASAAYSTASPPPRE